MSSSMKRILAIVAVIVIVFVIVFVVVLSPSRVEGSTGTHWAASPTYTRAST